MHRRLWCLKRKASRLRDWNGTQTNFGVNETQPLKRKASRLRDWNQNLASDVVASLFLKRKASRLRDWNKRPDPWDVTAPKTWKEKHLDYEIETCIRYRKNDKPQRTWKEKHLDYEIETCITFIPNAGVSFLKRKASRLRDWNLCMDEQGTGGAHHLKRKASRLRDWNQNSHCIWRSRRCAWKEKHLDYEIETIRLLLLAVCPSPLEKKSISITRLKRSRPRGRYHQRRNLKRKASRLRDWNERGLSGSAKITGVALKRKASRLRDWNDPSASSSRVPISAWKEKHLDYEIETKQTAWTLSSEA